MGERGAEAGWFVDDINTPSVRDKASVVLPQLLLVQCLKTIWLTHMKRLEATLITSTPNLVCVCVRVRERETHTKDCCFTVVMSNLSQPVTFYQENH